MSWPTQFNITTIHVGKNGYLPSLLAWGTDGIWQNVIVRNARSVPMVEEIRIENGSGLTATEVLINDGDFMELSVIDDRNIQWPITGGTVYLINPQQNGTSLSTTELFQVINNNYSVASKASGERTFLVKAYVLFNPVQM